jgi:RNA polymerase sigma factor (sigma-70 family)
MTMATAPIGTHLHGLHARRRATPASPKLPTNGELLSAARSATDPRRRDQAATALRLRIRSHCAAVLVRHAPSLGSDALEDMVQEVVLRLLAASEVAEPSGAYIHTIAHHLLIDRHRRQVRRGQDGVALSWEQLHEDSGFDPADNSPSPECSVVDKLSAQDLLARLKRHLRPREFAVFLARVDGKPHEEIAADLGLTNAHVRKIWERTQTRIRDVVPIGA